MEEDLQDARMDSDKVWLQVVHQAVRQGKAIFKVRSTDLERDDVKDLIEEAIERVVEFSEKLHSFKSPREKEYSRVAGMLRLQGRYEKALRVFRDGVVKELGDCIDAIVVYGSVARGKAREDSDIDVLIVERDKDVRSRVLEIGYDVDYENDFETFITSIYLTRDELEHRVMVGSPFIYEVLRDGVALYDDGTFKRIREKVFGASG